MLLIVVSLIGTASVLALAVPILIVYNALVLRRSRDASAGARVGYVASSVAFCVVLAAVLNVTGIPDVYSIRMEPDVNLVPFIDIFTSTRQYVLNVLLFVPVGFLLPVLWERFRKLRTVALAGFLLSLAIEVAQMFSFRCTDVDDLLMNTAGAMLGYGAFALLRRLAPRLALGGDALRRWRWEPTLYFATVWLGALFVRPYVYDWLWGAVM